MNYSKTLAEPTLSLDKKAKKALILSGRIWFIIAAIGHFLFALYIILHYGYHVPQGNYEEMNKTLGTGFIPGAWLSNLLLTAHVFLAFLVTFGGVLQFIPWIRARAINFHRYLGRIYLSSAFVISGGGIYLTFARNSIGTVWNHIGVSINALLIMSFAVMAWRAARRSDISQHWPWALRTFIMMGGVWFMRLGYGFWIFIMQWQAVGMTNNLDGPFDIFLAYASSLLPLAMVELYLWALEKGSPLAKYVSAGLISVASVATAIGIGMATLIFWLPRLM